MRPVLWGLFLLILLAAAIVWALHQAGKTVAGALAAAVEGLIEENNND